MKSDKILIIGANGYIGSRLIEYIENQYYITTCDRFPTFHTRLHINKFYDDLLVTEIAEFDTIILLAGNSSVRSCEGLFTDTYKNNVQNFERLLSIIKVNNLDIKVIYASSSSVYGRGYLFEELSDLPIPINNYDASKQMIDIIANRYIDDIELYGLRFGTVSGYSPNMRWDLVVNSMYKSAKVDNIINVINGSVRRPILAISDLCRSICRMLENTESGHRGIYNLASGNYSFAGIGAEIATIMDVGVDTKSSGNGSPYDFTISSDLFINTFGSGSLRSTLTDVINDLNINNAII